MRAHPIPQQRRMPITAKLHNSPNGRNANSSGKPTVATSSSDGWLSVENSRLHREVARLRRELEAYTSEEGQAALMEVQVENARLSCDLVPSTVQVSNAETNNEDDGKNLVG